MYACDRLFRSAFVLVASFLSLLLVFLCLLLVLLLLSPLLLFSCLSIEVLIRRKKENALFLGPIKLAVSSVRVDVSLAVLYPVSAQGLYSEVMEDPGQTYDASLDLFWSPS